MRQRMLPDDIAEGLEMLACGLIGRYAKNAAAWKSRRFHVFVFQQHPAYNDHLFEHAYAAGGL